MLVSPLACGTSSDDVCWLPEGMVDLSRLESLEERED